MIGNNYLTVLDFNSAITYIFPLTEEESLSENFKIEEFLTNQGLEVNSCQWMVGFGFSFISMDNREK